MCGKAHTHDREVVSDFANPHKKFLKLVALAIRITKICSKEPAWTVWNQIDLKAIIIQRVAKLKAIPSFASRCPCGAKKDRTLQAIKLDAAHFYKAASIERGIDAVLQLLDRVQERTRKSAVAIYRVP